MNNDKDISKLYHMRPDSWAIDDFTLKYYSGEMAIVWSIFRGETDSKYHMLCDFLKNFIPKNQKERDVVQKAKKELERYKTDFTIKIPEGFPTNEIADARIKDVFLRWSKLELDFVHTENLLYGLLTLSYSLKREFDNVDAIIIPDVCIKKYSNSKQEYLRILCEISYLNYKYARYLAEFDEHDYEVEQEYNRLLNKAFELVPDGDIVNSLCAIQAIENFFKNPTEDTSNKIYEIQKRLTGRNVVKNVLTLEHNGEIETGTISWGWQYLPRLKISYESDPDMIEALRSKHCKEPGDCLGELNMLFKTPLLIGIKTSEGNTLYWLISLLSESYAKKREVELINTALNKHIKLNQELVRNLSHSSANYLNSDRLAHTGVELYQASDGNPTIDQLHFDGLSLMLQSEQERYLSRQLNSLVWRCSADIANLAKQIKSGISRENGVSIFEPFEFALKIVLSRILFREDDKRSEFIKNKIGKSDVEWTHVESSFMLDILANKELSDGDVISWSRDNNIISIAVEISDVWKKLKIIKNKAFYDLIVEITTEQMLNALSHGNCHKPIIVTFGQAEERGGRPRWSYISCANTKGSSYMGGRGVGISTLNETLLLLNENKRGLEIKSEQDFESKAWLLTGLLRAR